MGLGLRAPNVEDDPMLDVRGVSKRYGSLVANDEVTFRVPPGRMVGFVGPNGAGKSTTMRSIMGLVAYDAGSITWRGDPMDGERLNRVGYLPEQRGLYPKMKIGEQVAYFAELKGLGAAVARQRTTDLLGDLGLADRLDDPLHKLSHGNQQRVQLAVALVTDPELLILDEPFNGLDPVAAETLHEVLAGRVAAGAAVLFSSHQLELVERICDELVVIADGRIRATGTIDSVRAERGRPRAVIRLERADSSLLDALDGLTILAHGERSATVALDDDRELDGLLARARQAGPILDLRWELPPLSELFADLVTTS